MLYELVRYWVMTADECARLRLVVPAEMTVSSNSLSAYWFLEMHHNCLAILIIT